VKPTLRQLLRPFKAPCLLPRRKRTLWTQPHMVRPALVKEKFGNGKRLICLCALMHRPYYYLVWVDDRQDLENSDEWFDQLEKIWTAIAEEFGERPYGSERRYRWPEEDSSGGCAWDIAHLEDVLPRRLWRKYLHEPKPNRQCGDSR
jgi:hypothetical protein